MPPKKSTTSSAKAKDKDAAVQQRTERKQPTRSSKRSSFVNIPPEIPTEADAGNATATSATLPSSTVIPVTNNQAKRGQKRTAEQSAQKVGSPDPGKKSEPPAPAPSAEPPSSKGKKKSKVVPTKTTETIPPQNALVTSPEPLQNESATLPPKKQKIVDQHIQFLTTLLSYENLGKLVVCFDQDKKSAIIEPSSEMVFPDSRFSQFKNYYDQTLLGKSVIAVWEGDQKRYSAEVKYIASSDEEGKAMRDQLDAINKVKTSPKSLSDALQKSLLRNASAANVNSGVAVQQPLQQEYNPDDSFTVDYSMDFTALDDYNSKSMQNTATLQSTPPDSLPVDSDDQSNMAVALRPLSTIAGPSKGTGNQVQLPVKPPKTAAPHKHRMVTSSRVTVPTTTVAVATQNNGHVAPFITSPHITEITQFQYPWQQFVPGKRPLIRGFTGTPVYIDEIWLQAYEEVEPTETLADRKSYVRGLLNKLLELHLSSRTLDHMNSERQRIMAEEHVEECSVSRLLGPGFMEHFQLYLQLAKKIPTKEEWFKRCLNQWRIDKTNAIEAKKAPKGKRRGVAHFTAT